MSDLPYVLSVVLALGSFRVGITLLQRRQFNALFGLLFLSGRASVHLQDSRLDLLSADVAAFAVLSVGIALINWSIRRRESK